MKKQKYVHELSDGWSMRIIWKGQDEPQKITFFNIVGVAFQLNEASTVELLKILRHP